MVPGAESWLLCSPPGSAGATIPAYTSLNTGNLFQLNVTLASMAVAQQTCNANGGHLAAYSSLAEQAEVESFYLSIGWLLPSFHKQYWLGMVSDNTAWPRFKYLDRSLPGDSQSGIAFVFARMLCWCRCAGDAAACVGGDWHKPSTCSACSAAYGFRANSLIGCVKSCVTVYCTRSAREAVRALGQLQRWGSQHP
jgi:hypothetical protein